MSNKLKGKTVVNQQPISYKGEVKLKLQKDGRTLKTYSTFNSGTFLLFSGIARFLAGQFTEIDPLNQNSYIPNYLGIGYQNKATTTDALSYNLYNEYNIARIKLNKGAIRTDSASGTLILPLTATITYSQIQNKPISELGLFATSEPRSETMLARVHLKDGQSYQLEPGMNWLVEWNIKIKNSQGL